MFCEWRWDWVCRDNEVEWNGSGHGSKQKSEKWILDCSINCLELLEVCLSKKLMQGVVEMGCVQKLGQQKDGTVVQYMRL